MQKEGIEREWTRVAVFPALDITPVSRSPPVPPSSTTRKVSHVERETKTCALTCGISRGVIPFFFLFSFLLDRRRGSCGFVVGGELSKLLA